VQSLIAYSPLPGGTGHDDPQADNRQGEQPPWAEQLIQPAAATHHRIAYHCES
jgi:hypothetical protein